MCFPFKMLLFSFSPSLSPSTYEYTVVGWAFWWMFSVPGLKVLYENVRVRSIRTVLRKSTYSKKGVMVGRRGGYDYILPQSKDGKMKQPRYYGLPYYYIKGDAMYSMAQNGIITTWKLYQLP